MSKRKQPDEDSYLELDFKKCKITDDIIKILHYSHLSKKWTVLKLSGETQRCDYEELKDCKVFQFYIYELLQPLQTPSYIT